MKLHGGVALLATTEHALKITRESWSTDGVVIYICGPRSGVYEERGPHIEAQLKGWGEQVFTALFGTGDVRDGLSGPDSSPSTRSAITSIAWDSRSFVVPTGVLADEQ